MAESIPCYHSRILWKTKRQQRMGVIINAPHAVIAFACFCFMHVDTGYDWGLTEALRTSNNGSEIREKMNATAIAEGHESAEDLMWKIKVLARVVSVVKQVSFGYCLLNVLKLVTCFPMWAPTGVMKQKDYFPFRSDDPYYCNPHADWTFETVCIYVGIVVYFLPCIGVLGIQFAGQMPKPLWPFIVGAALGMLAMLTPLAYGCVSIMSPPESSMMPEVSPTPCRLIETPESPTVSGNANLRLCLDCLRCLRDVIEIAK